MLSKKNLSMETLEKRELMAGVVNVSLSAGDLHIDGDANDNFIELYRLSSGKVRVQGIDTLVEGRSYRDFSVSDDIFITMSQGDNNVNFRNLNGGVRADLVRLSMSNGNDRVELNGLHARGDVEIHTWGGDDDIVVSNTSVGTNPFDRENLVVRSGTGEDSVRMTSVLAFGDVDIDTLDNAFADAEEDDFVSLYNMTIFDDLVVDTGAGDDDVYLRSSTILDDVTLRTGDGDDYVSLDRNDGIDRLRIDTGAGNDTLLVRRTESRSASFS